jgi:hypothetical protein
MRGFMPRRVDGGSVKLEGWNLKSLGKEGMRKRRLRLKPQPAEWIERIVEGLQGNGVQKNTRSEDRVPVMSSD